MVPIAQIIALLLAVATTSGGPARFELTSTAFHDGGTIPRTYSYMGYGCTGRNVSPELSWSAPPDGTKSFALTVFDPDAREGVGWWHWVIFNLPADTRRLAGGAGTASGDLLPPKAVQGRSDFQTIGYGGPCPPPGDPHHYRFTLYALDVELSGLSPLSSGPTVMEAMRGHILGKAELTGLFQR